MKGVYQTTNTDCVRACIASMFELPLEDVPGFNPENWGEEMDSWLALRGLASVNLSFSAIPYDPTIPHGYTLGDVPCVNPEFPSHWKHCVVCFDGYVIWCPKKGLQDRTQRAEEYTVIYPRDVLGIAMEEKASTGLACSNELLRGSIE